MKVKTIRRHGYGGSRYSQGQIYEIENEKHIRILEAVKKIERIPEKVEAPAPKKVEAPKKKKKKATKKQSPKNEYKRRDMFAEIQATSDEVVNDGKSDTSNESKKMVTETGD